MFERMRASWAARRDANDARLAGLTPDATAMAVRIAREMVYGRRIQAKYDRRVWKANRRNPEVPRTARPGMESVKEAKRELRRARRDDRLLRRAHRRGRNATTRTGDSSPSALDAQFFEAKVDHHVAHFGEFAARAGMQHFGEITRFEEARNPPDASAAISSVTRDPSARVRTADTVPALSVVALGLKPAAWKAPRTPLTPSQVNHRRSGVEITPFVTEQGARKGAIIERKLWLS
ncbi:hypothetical protein ACIBSV_30325 [Embleya sp. NPDC050154]|uniref:hypothetical protein n=1 Tax=Embleya sp. NPDC050154 TaxID=3363988 RepID=UPI0037B8C618